MSAWTTLASKSSLDATVQALKANGIEAYVVANAAEAKAKALELIPHGSEVLTNSSITVDAIGLGAAINDSGDYISLKKKMFALDRATQSREIAALVSSPAVSTGSAHAVTETGSLVIASMSGSQLPGYVFGSGKVVLVVSTQKITKDLEAANKRVYEHVLPLESVRARKAYNMPDTFHSSVNKLLIINKDVVPGRIHVILVQEILGF